MRPTLEDSRHLSRDGLEQSLIVEPPARTLYRLPEASAYQKITAAVVHWKGGLWCQIIKDISLEELR